MAEFDEIPPLVPDRETVVTDHPSFVEACKAAFSAEAQQFQWVLKNSSLRGAKDGDSSGVPILWSRDDKGVRTLSTEQCARAVRMASRVLQSLSAKE